MLCSGIRSASSVEEWRKRGALLRGKLAPPSAVIEAGLLEGASPLGVAKLPSLPGTSAAATFELLLCNMPFLSSKSSCMGDERKGVCEDYFDNCSRRIKVLC